MQKRLPPLNALYAFSIVGELQQITKCAETMNITQSAVSQQLRLLENYLGFSLYQKVGRKIALTDNGMLYAEELRKAFSHMRNATDHLLHEQRRENTLTINMYTTFATRWLIPKLIDFHNLKPEIEIRISTPTKEVDFSYDDIDAAIYVGRGDWKDLKSVFLFKDILVPVVSKNIDVKFKEYKSGKIFLDEPLLHVPATGRKDDWPCWLKSANFQPLSKHKILRYPTMDQAIHAAISGLGIAMVHKSFITKELRSGELKLAHEHTIPTPNAYYMVYPQKNSEILSPFQAWLLHKCI